MASRMKLTGFDQLWVGDITYIRLKSEFVYLAVIPDAFSRKVVGWALERTLASRLTIAALEPATAQRRPRPGLVHHSDRGLQYARGEYAALLEKHGTVPRGPRILRERIAVLGQSDAPDPVAENTRPSWKSTGRFRA